MGLEKYRVNIKMKQATYHRLTFLWAEEAQAGYPKCLEYSWSEAKLLLAPWDDEEEKKSSHLTLVFALQLQQRKHGHHRHSHVWALVTPEEAKHLVAEEVPHFLPSHSKIS